MGYQLEELRADQILVENLDEVVGIGSSCVEYINWRQRLSVRQCGRFKDLSAAGEHWHCGRHYPIGVMPA